MRKYATAPATQFYAVVCAHVRFASSHVRAQQCDHICNTLARKCVTVQCSARVANDMRTRAACDRVRFAVRVRMRAACDPLELAFEVVAQQ
eukprot:8176905-Lingulodinium_polyedra.AAC.1